MTPSWEAKGHSFIRTGQKVLRIKVPHNKKGKQSPRKQGKIEEMAEGDRSEVPGSRLTPRLPQGTLAPHPHAHALFAFLVGSRSQGEVVSVS